MKVQTSGFVGERDDRIHIDFDDEGRLVGNAFYSAIARLVSVVNERRKLAYVFLNKVSLIARPGDSAAAVARSYANLAVWRNLFSRRRSAKT